MPSKSDLVSFAPAKVQACTKIATVPPVSEALLMESVLPLLRATLGDFFARIKEHFFKSAENSLYINQQTEYLAVIDKLNSDSVEFSNAFSAAIAQGYQSNGNDQHAENSINTNRSDWSLTDTDVLERDLAVAKILRDLTAKGTRYYQAALNRYQQLCGFSFTNDEQFPYSLTSLLQAMRKTCAMLNLASKHEPVIIRDFESSLTTYAEKFYSDLASAFENQLKEMATAINEKNDSAVNSHDCDSNRNETSHLALTPLVSFKNGHDEFQLGPKEQSGIQEVNTSSLSSRENIDWEYLWPDQEEDDASKPNLADTKSEVLDLLHSCMRANPLRPDRSIEILHVLEAKCIEMQINWRQLPYFEKILQDTTSAFNELVANPVFPAQVRSLLGFLQIPALIYALQEDRFSDDLPLLAELIDTVAEISIGWPEPSAAILNRVLLSRATEVDERNDAPMQKRSYQSGIDPLTIIEPVLVSLLKTSLSMAEACGKAVEELESAWLPVKNRQGLLAKRFLAKEEGQERFAGAKQKAHLVYAEFRGNDLGLKAADEFFEQFLKRSMVICLLKNQFHNRQWDELVLIIQMFVEAARLSTTDLERRSRKAMANSIALKIRQVGRDYGLTGPQFSQLLKAVLAGIIKPLPTDEYQRFPSLEKNKPKKSARVYTNRSLGSEDDALDATNFSTLLLHFSVGNWVQLRLGKNTFQLKVAALRTVAEKIIFLNRSATASLSLSFVEVVALYQLGQLNVIPVTNLLPRAVPGRLNVKVVTESVVGAGSLYEINEKTT